NELYVYLEGQDSFFVSEIIAIDYDENGSSQFWIACPPAEHPVVLNPINQGAVLVAFPEGVKVQLQVKNLEIARLNRHSSIRASLPYAAARFQRRSYFRVFIDTDMQTHLKFYGPVNQAEITLLDLSLGGCSLHIEQAETPFKGGSYLGRADLYLTNQSSPIPVSLRIKTTGRVEGEPGYLLGCEMELLQRDDSRRLQRFLLQTERKQRVRQATHQ
ncbi:MAG: PilZ domain-containing protein, partial [Limnobacter sp.]|nr:PilZ domain-containing protein [Limnobacter sp.]